MPNKMTWEEMKKAYSEEWLLIVDFELDKMGNIKSGIVLRHSKSKDEVYVPLQEKKDTAFRYTGESTFMGLRSHATHHHAF